MSFGDIWKKNTQKDLKRLLKYSSIFPLYLCGIFFLYFYQDNIYQHDQEIEHCNSAILVTNFFGKIVNIHKIHYLHK